MTDEQAIEILNLVDRHLEIRVGGGEGIEIKNAIEIILDYLGLRFVNVPESVKLVKI